MGLYSYIVTHDAGFAPNPFHGTCTLACCKPGIRRSAEVSDLIIGLSSRCRTIVHVMRVDQIIGFADYWNDPAFQAKRPEFAARRMVERCGDNIYAPTVGGGFRQLPSLHSQADGSENLDSKRRDLGGGRVLVSTSFTYFGADGPELPGEFEFLKVGRAYRRRFTDVQEAQIRAWFATLPKGIHGQPAMWPAGDRTWKPSGCSASPKTTPARPSPASVAPCSELRQTGSEVEGRRSC